MYEPAIYDVTPDDAPPDTKTFLVVGLAQKDAVLMLLMAKTPVQIQAMGERLDRMSIDLWEERVLGTWGARVKYTMKFAVDEV